MSLKGRPQTSSIIVLNVTFGLVVLFSPFLASAQKMCQCWCVGLPSPAGNAKVPDTQCESICRAFNPPKTFDRAKWEAGNCTGTSPTPGAPAAGAQNIPTLVDPLGIDKTGLIGFVAKIINILLPLIGAGAFLMFLFGGAKILFSAGNPKTIESGRKIVIYAVAGLAIIFFSYAILSVFFSLL